MKYLFAVLAVLAMAGVASAAPFLVCDPQAGVTSYQLTGPSWVPASVSAQTDGSIRMDVAGATVGSNALTVKACKTDSVWGVQCSTAVPFAFVRPSAPVVPSGIGLVP
jgi:hypothetical protein